MARRFLSDAPGMLIYALEAGSIAEP